MSILMVNVVGLPGSGKSEVCRNLENLHGFKVFKPSEVIRAFAEEKNLPINGRNDLVACHQEMIENDPLAMIRAIDQIEGSKVCLDGLRAPETMVYLRERRSAVSVFLDCPDGVRYSRVSGDSSRTDERRFSSIEAFLEDERADYENPNRRLPNMNEMRETADYIVDVARLDPMGVCAIVRDIVRARYGV